MTATAKDIQIIATRKGPPFHVDGGLVYLEATAANTYTLKVPHPAWLLGRGAVGARKATSNKVASFIFGAGQKRAPSKTFL